jgi:dihydrofolate reductase
MIKLIMATNDQNIIGIGNKLPWCIPAEMAHFKKQTMNQTVVMGRNTWESIPDKYKPLSGRHNIVLSSSGSVAGAHETFSNIDALLLKYRNFTVIGGKEIYNYFIKKNLVDSIMLSKVKITIEDVTDAVFFDLPMKNFSLNRVECFERFDTYLFVNKELGRSVK